MHLFRAVYAKIAAHYYGSPTINLTPFKAKIQGHRMIARATNDPPRRAITMVRHRRSGRPLG